MKILYITSSFDKKGSASIRNISLVNGLIDNGNDVEVLTQLWPLYMVDSDLKKIINSKAKIHYDSLKIINMIFSSKNDLTKNEQTKIKKRVYPFLKRVIKNIYFFPDIDKEWISNYNQQKISFDKFDLIVSSSDTKTSHFVAHKISKMSNIPWVQIWGDPWFDDKGTVGFKKILAYFYEKWLISKAQKVFYISQPTLNAMKEKYKKYSFKMLHLKRSYLFEINNNKVITNDNYIFSYIGSIYYGRNIEPLILKINEFNKSSEKKITLNVYGTFPNNLVDNYMGNNYIKFNDYIEYNEVIKVMAKSDALIFMSNMSDSHQIPGKLYDYFGSYKTILALMESIDTPVSKFIQNTDRCIMYENKKESINLERVIKQINEDNQKPLLSYSSTTVANEFLKNINLC